MPNPTRVIDSPSTMMVNSPKRSGWWEASKGQFSRTVSWAKIGVANSTRSPRAHKR
jgi:hypothetical protein